MKMKTIITITCLLFGMGVFAQGMPVPTSINVTEAKYAQDGVERNGYDVVLQGSEKDINSAWASFLDSKYGFKVKSKSTTTSGEELMHEKLSDKRFSIQSGAIKDASGTHMRMWVFFGPDIVANSNDYPQEAANFKAMMKDFAKSYYIGVYQKELDDQTKVVSSQGKEVSGLSEDKAKIEKSIAKEQSYIKKAEAKRQKYQEKIQTYESKIVGLDNDIKKSKEEIESKKSKVSKTTNDLQKESEKYEDVEAAQKRIKEKIAAVERL